MDITLSEPKPGGGAVSYNIPVEMDLDPLYDVTISPLIFTLITGCSIVGANQIDLKWAAPDDFDSVLSYLFPSGTHFATKERETFTIREFSWARSEVSAAANLHKVAVRYEQIGLDLLGFPFGAPPGARPGFGPLENLVPGKTQRSNQGPVSGYHDSADCKATLDYTVTYIFRGYFGAAPDMRGVAAALGSPITAVARTPNYLDLFVTGTDGGIYSTWWDANGGWDKWVSVAGGRAALGSRVEVVSLTPNHLQLFVTGTDGNIYSTWWDANSGWANWFSVSGGSAALGAPITAVVRTPNHLDLFVTGADGNIYSIWWDANGGWDKWVNISGEK